MTYQQPKCSACDRGADFVDASGNWCARHTVDGLSNLTYACAGCREYHHPDLLDIEGLCVHCAQWAREYEDNALRDWRIG